MACTTQADILRAKTEDLGPELYAKAIWKDLWLNLVPRGVWPKGRGYVASVFSIVRSAPTSIEPAWTTIQSIANNVNGACNLSYDQQYVGEMERQYAPEARGIRGPVLCQDDLTHYWHSAEFWGMYYMRLEQIATMEWSQRLGTIYGNYVMRAVANTTCGLARGDTATQPPAQFLDLTAYLPGGSLGPPDSELLQDHLDIVAGYLIRENASEADDYGWITLGPDGPEYPLYIGMEASQLLALNNPELRSDLNQSFQGWGAELNPVLRRLGASRKIRNFRHVVNPFPPRWIYVPYGATVNYTATGLTSNAGTVVTYTNTVAANATNPSGTPTAVLNVNLFLRIPHYVKSADSTVVTKGYSMEQNGVWVDPNVTASNDGGAAYQCEGAFVLHPRVMTEEIVEPMNSLPGAKFNAQNYFGEWSYIDGNDAFLGMDSCTGISDPKRKKGRHFAEYRHAVKPIFPEFGVMVVFRRCASVVSRSACS